MLSLSVSVGCTRDADVILGAVHRQAVTAIHRLRVSAIPAEQSCLLAPANDVSLSNGCELSGKRKRLFGGGAGK